MTKKGTLFEASQVSKDYKRVQRFVKDSKDMDVKIFKRSIEKAWEVIKIPDLRHFYEHKGRQGLEGLNINWSEIELTAVYLNKHREAILVEKPDSNNDTSSSDQLENTGNELIPLYIPEEENNQNIDKENNINVEIIADENGTQLVSKTFRNNGIIITHFRRRDQLKFKVLWQGLSKPMWEHASLMLENHPDIIKRYLKDLREHSTRSFEHFIKKYPNIGLLAIDKE